MNFLSKITKDHVKYLLTTIAVSSIVVGFFLDKIASEVFYTTIGSIITHFYQNSKVEELNKKVQAQDIEIQSLKNG
jgi:hypothetical protein